MINVYFIILVIFIKCDKTVIYRPINIQIDNSNLIFKNNNELLYQLKEELNNTKNYINDLLYTKYNGEVFSKISNITTPYLICENNESFLFNKSLIDKSTTLLILPQIIINPFNSNKNNNNYNVPKFYPCLKEDNKPLVIIINFLFSSKKDLINMNFANFNYHWLIIRFILSSLGFNQQYLIQKNIPNNIISRNQKLLYRFNYYKSFQKFSFLTNYTISDYKDNKNYVDYWPSLPKLDDIMQNINFQNDIYPSVTEITLNLIKSIGYKYRNCELLFFNNICYKVDQKCLNQFKLENYYLYYTIDEINKRWICYVNNEENFKRNECGNIYGLLLRQNELNKNLLIDYFRKKDNQHLNLLKPSPLCPKPHPRTIFFSSMKSKEDPYQYKYLDRIDQIIIKNPKYFIIGNTYSNSYNVKNFNINYNGIYTHNNKYWNYNFYWDIYPNSDDKEVFIHKNKYQLIGQFPGENTYKDGINYFYNKLKNKFPNDYNYMPETYKWPEQKNEITNKFINYEYNPKDVWLFKPARDSFGNGIKIIDNYEQIKNSFYYRFLISKYIMNPMLINNKKFDMRAYVLVTGMNPLKIYFFKDGYIKITVKNFTLDYKSINDNCVHITTSDINLKCYGKKEYKYDTNIYDEKSNFWSFLQFERYCNKNGVNYTHIIEQMKDIVIKTFISLNSDFIKLINENNLKDRNLFQLYGLDLIVDNNYKVYLLEINRNPSMRGGHAVCDYIFDNIISDTLNIVGVVPFSHDDSQEPMDNNIYYYNNEIEEIVDDSLCEFSRPRGLFELIYPLKNNINKYKKFFQNITKENKSLWNKLLESNGEYN